MIEKIEEISLNAWPAIKTIFYDGWVLRFANGYTKRSNSINPIYHSHKDAMEKIKRCEKIYESINQKAIFKITDKVYPADLDLILHESGYKDCAYVSVRTKELEDVYEPSSKDIIVFNDLDNMWFDNYCELSNIGTKDAITLTQILENIIPETYFIALKTNGKISACGLGVIENEFMGIFNIIVDPDYRKQGLGRDIMLHLMNIGRQNGASLSYLQVMKDNTAAINLYEKLGFDESYQYWYRMKP